MKYAKNNLPNKIELEEGLAYVRYQGYTYRVNLSYFKLEADPNIINIEVKGYTKGPI